MHFGSGKTGDPAEVSYHTGAVRRQRSNSPQLEAVECPDRCVRVVSEPPNLIYQARRLRCAT